MTTDDGLAASLAAELEQAYYEFADHLACLRPEQWRSAAVNSPDVVRGADERRPVSVVAHHVGDMLPVLADRAQRLAVGERLPALTPHDLDAINAKHALVNRNPNQAETVAMIRDCASRAAAVIRELTDQQLRRTGRAGGRATTAERFVRRIVIGHVAWHDGSIRATVDSSSPPAGRADVGSVGR